MPFIITREQPHGSKLYIQCQGDGEMFWHPNKDKATRFEETEADAGAAEINKYASTEAVVEGAR